jgi:glycerol-3-phosphate dehydrogenase
MAMRSARLGPEQRREALDRMAAEEFDVVVIGGGVTGAGCALEAVTRGLSVALVEQRDYAAGTSSRASKLIHGGVRYLEQRDFTLVREALRERDLLITRLAPHLVRTIPFVYPLTRGPRERAYVGSGLRLYDTLGGTRAVPRHRHLSRRATLRRAPALRPDRVVGGVEYYDGEVDDARLTLTVARTAARYGAVQATSARAVGFLLDGERVAGVRVRDLESGRELDLRARRVIDATGVWTEELLPQLQAGRHEFRVRVTKGVHIVVPRERIRASTAMTLRTETNVLFVLPWGRHWIIGTTDTDWDLDLAHPAATRSDIDYLLERANRMLVDPLTWRDVEGVYVGLRPLIAGEAQASSQLSRHHAVEEPLPGLVVVAGGKLTIYRRMGVDAVAAAVRGLDRRVPPSVSAQTPLVGAAGYQATANRREAIAAESGLPLDRVEHLLGRYGSRIDELLALVAERPELGRPIGGAEDYLRVEAVYGTSHEGALHLNDVLTRRTRISFEQRDGGLAAAEEVARLMAPVLGWDEAAVRREVDSYRARVAAERESHQQSDDSTAEEARLAAPDVRVGATAG